MPLLRCFPDHNLLSEEHPDVDETVTPAGGDVLTYNAAKGQWEAQAPTGGGHVLRDEGVDLPQRTGLNFIGGLVAAVDDAAGNESEVRIGLQPDGTDLFATADVAPHLTIGRSGKTIALLDTLRFATAGVAHIQDSGGNERLRFATTSPNITLTGNARINGNLALPNVSPLTNVYLLVRNAGAVDSVTGLTVDLGGSTSAGTNVILGVGGRAIAKDPATAQAIGLEYLAGMQNHSISMAIGARTVHLAVGSGFTITDAYGFYASTPSVILGAITNLYGFYAPNLTGASNRYAAQFDGPTSGVPLFRVLSGVNPGANQTNLFLAETTGTTTTLRRVQWKDGAAIGAGDKVMVLV